MFELQTIHLQILGAVLLSGSAALLCYYVWRWLERRINADPLDVIFKIDRQMRDVRAQRLLRNLQSLDEFYTTSVLRMPFSETEVCKAAMDQIEDDAKAIVEVSGDLTEKLFKILKKLGYAITIYRFDEFSDPVEWEIHGRGYSVVCKFYH